MKKMITVTFILSFLMLIIFIHLKLNHFSIFSHNNKGRANQKLVIMTYNVKNNYNDSLWFIRKFYFTYLFRFWLSKRNIDVFCLQEVTPDQLLFFEKLLEREFLFFERGRDLWDKDEKLAIFYRKSLNIINKGRFWFSNTPVLPGSKFEDMEFSRICIFLCIHISPKVQIIIFNTHLDDKGVDSRLESIKIILTFINKYKDKFFIKSLIAFIVGDFNDIPHSKAIAFLLKSGFETTSNVLIASKKDFTYQPEKLQIDYIFFKVIKQIKNCESAIHLNYHVILSNNITKLSSDHFPIISSFNITSSKSIK